MTIRVQSLVFRRLALGQVLYLLAVIIYGALVRATRSGAGCGANWPLCNGQVLPRLGELATAIEFGHRVSSGLCLPLALWVAYEAYRLRSHFPAVYRAALATVVLVLVEAGIGASLVLLEHVAYNTSSYRALTVSVHLLSSNLLLACALLSWQLCDVPQGIRSTQDSLPAHRAWTWLLLSGGVIVLTNFSGAFTVLADTLFPSPSIGQSFAEAAAAGRHIFVKMRIVHPFIAIASSALVLVSYERLVGRRPYLRVYQRVSAGLFLGQGLLGMSNILWPGALALQLAHLLLAELLWLGFVMLATKVLRTFDAEQLPVSPRIGALR